MCFFAIMNESEAHNVWVFFYGTFMRTKVLHEYGIHCKETSPAKLNGFELIVRPRVNLIKREGAVSYGGLAYISHRDIFFLYDNLRKNFGIIYSPYPVIAQLSDGRSRPALCYIALNIEDGKPDPLYIEELIGCAKQVGASPQYLDHIQSFI